MIEIWKSRTSLTGGFIFFVPLCQHRFNTGIMAKEDNLKPPWKKGETGNPVGRIKGSKNRATVARECLALLIKGENPLTGEEESITAEYLMTLKQIKKAIDSQDTNAYKAIMDSAFGAPKQEVEQTNIERKPPNIKFTKGDKK